MTGPSKTGYNGWTNYETWCVNMWLSNDEGLYTLTREMATEAKADDPENFYGLANDLKAFVEELPEVLAVTESDASFVTDLLGAALSSVDWTEIAANLLTEVEVDA